jgi:hypothetical protein
MSETTGEFGGCSCDVALRHRLGQACNEEAFRHFLAMERRRSQRSGRAFLVLLVRMHQHSASAGPMPSSIAEKVFACLWACLRETDQVGWFREGRVAGALLADVSDANVAAVVCEKVRGSLRAGLSRDIVSRLDVRVFRLPSPPSAQG